jgi:hypothetical protein
MKEDEGEVHHHVLKDVFTLKRFFQQMARKVNSALDLSDSWRVNSWVPTREVSRNETNLTFV